MVAGVTPRLWIKLDFGEGAQIGPGKIALLEAVGREKSISAAARAIGMSYRRAWVLIDQVNQVTGQPVVETRMGGRRGGGAVLTEAGYRLVDDFRRLQDNAEARLQEDLDRLVANALLADTKDGGGADG